ncbi:MAG: hypothetical protein Q4C64_07540 [Erysipelotrichia bacterium]|nr:hypothetical protein [Erysipelotrichia bacterium]
MSAIKYYTDTVVEYELAKLRRKSLLEKKEEIYVKYFGIKSSSRFDSEPPQANTSVNRDKMVLYLNEIELVEHNGVTLKQEIETVEMQIKRLENEIAEMERLLSKLDSIEGKLYFEIVVNRKKVSEAVSCVADKYYTSESSIWHTYYPKIKGDIYRIKRLQKH